MLCQDSGGGGLGCVCSEMMGTILGWGGDAAAGDHQDPFSTG